MAEEADGIALSDYCSLLGRNSRFRCLFAAYLVTNSGNWINYVAALAFIHRSAVRAMAEHPRMYTP